jgi:hypothetical protein
VLIGIFDVPVMDFCMKVVTLTQRGVILVHNKEMTWSDLDSGHAGRFSRNFTFRLLHIFLRCVVNECLLTGPVFLLSSDSPGFRFLNFLI